MRREEMREDDAFAGWLRASLEGYRPEVPAEEMWERVREARSGRPVHPGRPRWKGWTSWGLAAAAVAALAVGVVRLLPEPDASAGAPASPMAPGGTYGEGGVAFDPAVTEHMEEAELLLVMFRSEPAVEPATRRWARSLLGTTRILLDSPAAADVRVAETLEDLELVLVQIVNLPTDAEPGERGFVEETLRDRQVLAKLRAAVYDAPSWATRAGD